MSRTHCDWESTDLASYFIHTATGTELAVRPPQPRSTAASFGPDCVGSTSPLLPSIAHNSLYQGAPRNFAESPFGQEVGCPGKIWMERQRRAITMVD
jgi:hypothetical protein